MIDLVTGAAGFLGSAVTRSLLARGRKVRVLVQPNADQSNLKDLDVEFVRGDVTAPETLVPALKCVRTLYHTAGLYALSNDAKEYERVNVIGTRNLLAAAQEAGVKRLVYTSNASTVGSAPPDGVADETGIWDLGPLELPYFTSKHLAETECLRAAAQGLDVVIVNPGMMLGERDRPSSPSGRWLIEFLNGRLLAVPPMYINIVDVDDVAEGHLLAAERGQKGERYLLTNWNTTAEELLTRVGQLTGRRPPLVVPYEVAFAGAAVGGAVLELLGISHATSASLVKFAQLRMHFSNEKAVRELGFNVTPVDATLEKAVRWLNASEFVKRRL